MKKKIWILLFAVAGFSASKAQTTGSQACVINGAGQPGPINNGTTGYVYTQLSPTTVGWGPAASSSYWSLTGNAGLSPATNFLGTTDSSTLVFKVNGVQSGWIDDNIRYGNTFFGYGVGRLNYGVENTAIGFKSFYSNTIGNTCTSIGNRALYSNTTGVSNIAMGNGALEYNIGGGYNTAIGVDVFNAVNAYGNTGVGFAAESSNNTGSSNTAIGNMALFFDNGSFNTGIGDSAGYNNNTGLSNVFVGYQSGVNNTSGSYNIFIGDSSAYGHTHGNFNTCIGENSGISTSSNNSTALGYNAVSNASNQVVLGNTRVTSFVFNGDLEAGNGNTGTSGQVLTSQGSGVSPQWTTVSSGSDSGVASGTGINITAAKPRVVSIKNTAVTAGTYTLATVTFNAQGQATSASSGTTTNYLQDTVGGSGSTPQLVTKQVLRTDTTNANSFIVGNAYMKSYVAQHSGGGGTNYLNDTVGGSGTKPVLSTETSGSISGGISGQLLSSNGSSVATFRNIKTYSQGGILAYNNATFSSADWTGSGSGTFTFTGGVITATGTGANYSSYITYTKNNLGTVSDNNSATVKYVVGTVGTGNNGLGVGYTSINPNATYNWIAYLSQTSTSGTLYLTCTGNVYGPQPTMTIATGDSLEGSISRIGDIMYATWRDITSGAQCCTQYQCNVYTYGNSNPVFPNQSYYSIYAIGTVPNVVTEFRVDEYQPINANLAILGDSKEAGAFVIQRSSMLSQILSYDADKIQLNAGFGDFTFTALADTTRTKILHPINMIIMLGSNDIRYNYSTSSIIANLQKLYNCYTRAGINVTIATIAPEDVQVFTTINALIRSTFTTHVIDVYNLLVDAGGTSPRAQYISGDGVHPTALAQEAIKGLIYYQFPTIFNK